MRPRGAVSVAPAKGSWRGGVRLSVTLTARTVSSRKSASCAELTRAAYTMQPVPCSPIFLRPLKKMGHTCQEMDL